MTAQQLPDDAERLQALQGYNILDTPPEAIFDDLTRLAARACDAPYAIISLIGDDRPWFKSRFGLSFEQAPVHHAMCMRALSEPRMLVVRDTWEDRRFCDYPQVAGEPYIRFFAGAVLRTPQGVAIGSLCVMDTHPREISAEQQDALLILARQVMAQLELRRSPSVGGAAEGEDAAILETLAQVGAELTAELDLERLLQKITDAATALTGAKFGALFHNEKNADGELYQLYNLSGAPSEAFGSFPAPRKTDVFGPTFRGEGVVRSADITMDPRYGKNLPHNGLPAGHLPVRSYLAVPVVSRSGEVLGGLLFGHPERGVFTDRAERLATGIAAQAAIAIDNARLYKLTTDHQAHLAKLVDERTQELEASNQRLQREMEERRQAEDALRQAQKMEAIGQLTGGVAHDFNNLLQVIGANLQLLETAVSDERTRQRVRTAVSAVDRGAKLSAQLLAFARRQPLEPCSTNLGRRLKDMDDLLHRTLGAEIALRIIIDSSLWNTFVDPVQVENVILNLALNARDAMPEGGNLTIEATNATVAASTEASTLGSMSDGEYVMLTITDTGCGMSPELINRVFEPFFTTKEAGRGTGLGLSQVYGFVKQSNGHIDISSRVGQGTAVRLYLPRALQDEQRDVSDTAPEPGCIEMGNETVLVAEDNPDVREATVDMLHELGYQVLQAVDGQSALSLLASHREVELLFSDVVMPGPVKAPQLAAQAQQLQPNIAVLFTSGYTQNAIVHDGRLDPGVDLLSKPYSREQLARKLRHALRNREQRLAAREAQEQHQQEPQVLEQSSPDYECSGVGRRVLMVEDDPEVLQMISMLVTELGHQVVEFTHAEQALEALEKQSFDILFTDVGLPDMSGIELARQALERCNGLRVIFASGYGDNLATDDLPSARIDTLPKPYNLADIERVLQ